MLDFRAVLERRRVAQPNAWPRRWLCLSGLALATLRMHSASVAGAPPPVVYVDASYPSTPAIVTFPNSGGTGAYVVGSNAFNTIQAAVDHVADMGTVYVSAGIYIETNLSIQTRVTLLGPNAGKAGTDPKRAAEARIIPGVNDPYDTGIISVETNSIVVDGFLLDGNNPALGPGLPGNGAELHAAAGVQNGVVESYLTDVSQIRVQNSIIRNVSYDGVYLDRVDYPTTSIGNYIVRNKLENMWEGVSTYNAHTVIAFNTFTNLNHGIGVHMVTNAAPGFTPIIASNSLTIAQWWPTIPEGELERAPGIWVNYRRHQAPPLQVIANEINTPLGPPPGKRIIGLWALRMDDSCQVNFIDNTINGGCNCTEGFYAAICTGDNVKLLGGALNNMVGAGVLADTADPKYGAGDALVTISNVTVILSSPTAVGVLAVQETSTPVNKAEVTVIGNTSISGGGLAGVQVLGPNAAAIVRDNTGSIIGASVGIDVDAGKALIENNNLTGNTTAAIRVSNNGVVDAGDCRNANVTGLGSSDGRNTLSGYGFDGFGPWAIQNLGSVAVLAHNNAYGATAGDTLASVFLGPVNFCQSGGTPIRCPPALVVQNLGQVPGAAETMAGFLADGGLAADTAGTLGSWDTFVTNEPGHHFITRTYTLIDLCGQTTFCQQSIAELPLISLGGYASGHPTVSINGQQGHQYAVQASTNLVQWENLFTNTAPYDFVDRGANGCPYRFYRALILP